MLRYNEKVLKKQYRLRYENLKRIFEKKLDMATTAN